MAAFTNQATLSYNGKTASSNVVTGEMVGALTAAKTALEESYSAGDTLTYVVTLVNSGAAALDGITLTDDLGAYEFNSLTLVPLTYVEGSAKYFVNGVLQPGPSVTAGESLVFSGLSVPAGGSAVLVYNARVNSYAPLGDGSVITNNVTTTGAKIGSNVAADDTVTAESEPLLDITKAICPAVVEENGTLTYTFVISNTGSAEAGEQASPVLEDTFEPVLTDISVTLDGAALAEGTGYTYDEVTGEFATLPGVITVPAADFAQDPQTGEWSVTPGTATLIVSGTV